MRLVTLLFICDKNRVLLGKKKVRFGAGYWNGFGGGVEPGETVEESACREALEEACISVQPEHLEKIAHITFSFEEKPEFNHDVHVFKTNVFEGEPLESDEMIP